MMFSSTCMLMELVSEMSRERSLLSKVALGFFIRLVVAFNRFFCSFNATLSSVTFIGTRPPVCGCWIPMNVTELRVALKEQKKRLNATTSLMKNPSATLLNRDRSRDISLTNSINMQVDENIIMDRTWETEGGNRETSLCEAKDPVDEVFSLNKNGSGIDAESGFGGSQSIINPPTDQMFQNEKIVLDKPRVSHVSEEGDFEDDHSNVNNNSQLI